MTNKYHARKTYSQLCDRIFDSKAEARRAEELRLLEMAKEIEGLGYQVKFVLCEKPRITITVDFSYNENGVTVYEDVKGMMMREFRVKLAWLKEKHGVSVKITR